MNTAALRTSGNPRDQILADATRELSNQQHLPVSLHSVSPSYAPKHGEEVGDMRAETFPRTGGRKLSRVDVEQRLSDALADTLPQYTVPAKTVAAEIEASPRTVENLRQRVPDAMVTLVMIARAYPKFGSQVARLMALDAELDPGFQREFAEFLRRARET